MHNEDTDSAALQLRCFQKIQQLDGPVLQLIASLLELIQTPATAPRKRAARGERSRNTAGEKETTA